MIEAANRSLESKGGHVIATSMAVLSLTAALCVPMLWLHRSSTRNLISFHGTLHAALGQSLLQGDVPPENPYFAGETVRYYWVYHWVGSLIARSAGVNVLYAFEAMSIIAAIVLAGACVALGRRALGSTAGGAVIYFLVLAGANPLGWAILLAKVARDGAGIMDGPATAVVSPILQQVQFGDHRFGPNLTFFMHMTSRSVALALLVADVWFLWEWLRHGRAWAAIAVVLTIALSIAMSPLVGLGGAGALALSFAAARTWERGRTALSQEKTVHIPRMYSSALLLMGGAVLALPTMLNILGKQTNVPTATIDPTRLKLYGIIAMNGGPLVLLALLGMCAGRATTQTFLRVLLLAGGILLGWSAVLAMPGTIPPDGVIGNEHNLFNAAIALLAIPAAAWLFAGEGSPRIIWLRSVPRRTMATLGLFLPTAILVLTAYTSRADIPVRCDPDRLVWTSASDSTAMLYNWVNARTPPDAVFVVDPATKVDRLCNVSDLPAFTNRRLFTDQMTYMVEAYPEAAFRLHWSGKIARGEDINADAAAYIERLNRPVFVLTHEAANAALMQRLRQWFGPEIFLEGRIAVFAWTRERMEHS